MLRVRLYTLIVCHGRDFRQVPHKSYTSDIYKKYENVNVENMVVEELKDSLVDIMGEYDSLFFCTDGKFIKNGISILCNGSKIRLLKRVSWLMDL